MQIDQAMSTDAILREIGERLAQHRLQQGVRQVDLCAAAGVSRRTLQRIEAGEAADTRAFLQVLRALSLLDGLDQLIPPVRPSPMDALLLQGKQRRRARQQRQGPPLAGGWRWGDEAID